jgi:hypothetical protein
MPTFWVMFYDMIDHVHAKPEKNGQVDTAHSVKADYMHHNVRARSHNTLRIKRPPLLRQGKLLTTSPVYGREKETGGVKPSLHVFFPTLYPSGRAARLFALNTAVCGPRGTKVEMWVALTLSTLPDVGQRNAKNYT